ncbi:MAG: SMC family ATPase [Spirochaetales bacterium]|nr:SMC family ATPase [Spirochaetales bacterium]
MKPLLLEVEGLYSYRERTSIDFEKLTRAGLFGIFGSVGSGKSAILEAITFALYGETARMNRNERAYNMMNLRSDKLMLDFRFQVRGEVYRFTASSTRNSKDFNDIKNPKRGAYKDVSGEWVPLDGGVSENAERILGLNYLNFRRTIIIPQGKFQEFLQLTKSERTTMLEELFNLEKFNLQQKTSSLIKKTQLDLEGINGQLLQMEEINREKISELQTIARELEASQLKKREQIDLLDVKEKELSRKGGLARELSELQVEFAEADIKRKEADLREAAANRLEEIRNFFAVPIRTLKDSRKKLIQREAEFSESLAEEGALTERRRGKDEAFLSFSNAFALKDEYTGMVENLDKLIKLKVRDGELAEKNKLRTEGEGEIKDLAFRETELTETVNGIRSKIEGDRKTLPPVAERIALQRWLDDQARYAGELEKARGEVENLKADVRALELKYSDKMEISPFALNFSPFFREGKISTDGLRDALEVFENRIRTQRDELREVQSRLILQERLADLAGGLVDGLPCPLCGSPDHPGLALESDVDKAGETKGESTVEAENPDESWEAFGALKSELLIFLDLSESLEKRVSNRSDDLSALEREASSHASAFKWEAFASGQLEEDQKIIEGFHSLEEVIRQDEGRLPELERTLKTITATSEALKEAAVRQGEEIAGLAALADSLRREIPEDFIEEHKELSSEELQKKAGEIRFKLEGLEAERTRLEAEETLLLKEEARLYQKLEIGRSLTAEAEEEIQDLEDVLQVLLDKSEYGNRAEIEESLKSEVSLKDERREIQLIRQEASRLENRILDLKKELGDFEYRKEAHDTLLADLLQLKSEWEEGVRRVGEINKGIQDVTEKLQEKDLLLGDRNRLLSREENLKTLFSMFKARGFVNYVSTLYLRELVEGANRRFETLCSRSMKLELRDDNSFAVRDFLNGGKLRSVKTLSGGQTFLASLSLALALADSVNAGNRQTGEEGFFFLDEGFGSLDKDSLRIVMEALWSLGKEKRVVGVISHVEEMKEEIPSFILVSKDEERGSSVTPGWTL